MLPDFCKRSPRSIHSEQRTANSEQRKSYTMQEAVIVSAVRTAVGKAPSGTLRFTRPDDMAAVVISEALKRAPGLDPAEVEDVVMGCAMPEAEQGLNVARIASLRAGVPVSAS